MNPSATTQTNTSAPVAATPDNGPDCERVNTVLDQLIEGQSVTVKASGSLTVEASGSLTVKGASITVQASGVCQVKGAQVMLG